MGSDSERWDVRRAQAELEAIYQQKFPELVSALADFESETLSYPQLLDVSAQHYDTAGTKLLIVGQQTEKWYGEWKNLKTLAPEIAIRKLLDHYREFNLGDGKRHSPFWRYAHKLYKLLNSKGPSNGFIWSNLIKMDGLNKKNKWGYSGWPIAEQIFKSFDVLPSEVDLARPDVVVFFTGHSYDEHLEMTFPGAELSTVPRSCLDGKWLSAVRHARLPKHSYRIYHPGYLNRQPDGISVLEAICNLVA
jgi:hypothetical protein